MINLPQKTVNVMKNIKMFVSVRNLSVISIDVPCTEKSINSGTATTSDKVENISAGFLNYKQ